MSTVIASRVLTTHPHPHQPARQRPSRADLTPIDPELIEAWTAANLRARRAYYSLPNACTWEIWDGGRHGRR